MPWGDYDLGRLKETKVAAWIRALDAASQPQSRHTFQNYRKDAIKDTIADYDLRGRKIPISSQSRTGMPGIVV